MACAVGMRRDPLRPRAWTKAPCQWPRVRATKFASSSVVGEPEDEQSNGDVFMMQIKALIQQALKHMFESH